MWPSFIWHHKIPSLKLNFQVETQKPKRKGSISSSNHQLSGANLLLVCAEGINVDTWWCIVLEFIRMPLSKLHFVSLGSLQSENENEQREFLPTEKLYNNNIIHNLFYCHSSPRSRATGHNELKLTPNDQSTDHLGYFFSTLWCPNNPPAVTAIPSNHTIFAWKRSEFSSWNARNVDGKKKSTSQSPVKETSCIYLRENHENQRFM